MLFENKRLSWVSLLALGMFIMAFILIFQAITSQPANALANSQTFLPQVSRITVYPVSGQVLDSEYSPVQDVVISTGSGVTVSTDVNGAYTFHLVAGSYTLTPARLESVFKPMTLTVTIPPEVSGRDFCMDCAGPIIDMVNIPAGEFQMGCSPGDTNCVENETPLHTVYVSAFDIDKYEVTNARYAACVNEGGCTPPQLTSSYTRPSYYGNPAYDNYPVIYIDWNQAKAFCEWEGKRLPTEAEWEKVARGSEDTRIYPWGDEQPSCNLANMRVDGIECTRDTTEVGSYPGGASPYGVLDMAGNVEEWISDYYKWNYYSSQSSWVDPTGPTTGESRVMRSGAFFRDLRWVRTAHRSAILPTNICSCYGVRCARSR